MQLSDVERGRLEFVKWLVETGRLEGDTAGGGAPLPDLRRKPVWDNAPTTRYLIGSNGVGQPIVLDRRTGQTVAVLQTVEEAERAVERLEASK